MLPNAAKKSLFKEKVTVCKESLAGIQTDALVNLCFPNILYGSRLYRDLHLLAGPGLVQECDRFRGMCPTSARVTDAYEANNFKCTLISAECVEQSSLPLVLVHAVCPPLSTAGDPIDQEKVYLTIRNALDKAAEEAAATVVGFLLPI